MANISPRLHQDFEQGKLTWRQLVLYSFSTHKVAWKS